MPQIKTKTVLKAQRDALARFQRYLPTLEFKKQQLKLEVMRLDAALEKNRTEYDRLRAEMARWERLFGEEIDVPLLISLEETIERSDNIAGVAVPVFEDAHFAREPIDLYTLPPWVDDAVVAMEKLTRLAAEAETLRRGRALLAEELRITSQRVNLFEKIKIPECREHIRVIKIALGDAQTAAVARAKLAKAKTLEVETATA